MRALIAVALLALLTIASGHTRWKYPTPRSSNSGIKGPCENAFAAT